MANTEVKVMFRSGVSGLWYTNPNAAGAIDQVKIDDEVFKRPLNYVNAQGACQHQRTCVTYPTGECDQRLCSDYERR